MSKSNCAIERALSSTAKKFQTLPASTISVERLFSVGGNVLDDKRKKLKAKSVSRLKIFLEGGVTGCEYVRYRNLSWVPETAT